MSDSGISRFHVPFRNLNLFRSPFLAVFIGNRLRFSCLPVGGADTRWLGWGAKPSARWAQIYARLSGGRPLLLEDGFLRSYGLGVHGVPALSIVVDDLGIYFDARKPSRIEQLLQDGVFSPEILQQAEAALALLQRERLTKYNVGTEVPDDHFAPDVRRVLVVDQTLGDASITGGLADEASFLRMLDAAVAENPGAEVWVKTHPDVLAGKRASCLSAARGRSDVRWITQDWHPHSLLAHFERVYVVTSQMGLDALIVGRPVTCFGVPFYSGWGLTDDRVPCERRAARRSLVELIAAAYLLYARYLDPETGKPGNFFQVADFIVRQRRVQARWPRRFVAVGFRAWKAAHLTPILGMAREGVRFVRDAEAARALGLRKDDGLIHWGRDAPQRVEELARATSTRLFHLEDGFYRSVGLGSDLIRPRSVVIDEQGLYFDPRGPSDLEQLLNTAAFSPDELEQARWVRSLIVEHGLTKYNLEPLVPVDWPAAGRTVVLVPGQVEDDASIRHGCESVRTNLDLMQVARETCPDAFIVFKPHPDVASGNRHGAVQDDEALRHVDWVERKASMVSCLDGADAVHTMTSMAGFEALLRGKRVVVYGRPFYAGWGLTEDRLSIPRRTRKLTLDELVAVALLRYPLYWDWELKGFTSCEAVLRRLIEERDALTATGGLERLRAGWLRRQGRKIRALVAGLRSGA